MRGRAAALSSLGVVTSVVAGGIWYVHWEQKEERERLREGVERDKRRQESKRRKRFKTKREKK